MAQVFVTAQARTIELANCYVLQPSSVLVTVPADVKQALLERLAKYIFFGDQVCPCARQGHHRQQGRCLSVFASGRARQDMKTIHLPCP